MTYRRSVQRNIRLCDNFLCLGFDLNLSVVPAYIKRSLSQDSIEGLCYLILDVFAGKVPAIKFQMAFFESLGWRGLKLLQNLVTEAKKLGAIVILDGKRGDISSTMKAYGSFFYKNLKADAITVSPYMGADTLIPLQEWLLQGRGVYLLGYTSNHSGRELQFSLAQNGMTIAENVFEHTRKDFDESLFQTSVGVVLGAESSRVLLEDGVFGKLKPFSLVPGVGAQGGVLLRSVHHFFCQREVDLVSVSRSLIGLGNSTCKELFSQFHDEISYKDFLLERCTHYIQRYSLSSH